MELSSQIFKTQFGECRHLVSDIIPTFRGDLLTNFNYDKVSINFPAGNFFRRILTRMIMTEWTHHSSEMVSIRLLYLIPGTPIRIIMAKERQRTVFGGPQAIHVNITLYTVMMMVIIIIIFP